LVGTQGETDIGRPFAQVTDVVRAVMSDVFGDERRAQRQHDQEDDEAQTADGGSVFPEAEPEQFPGGPALDLAGDRDDVGRRRSDERGVSGGHADTPVRPRKARSRAASYTRENRLRKDSQTGPLQVRAPITPMQTDDDADPSPPSELVYGREPRGAWR